MDYGSFCFEGIEKEGWLSRGLLCIERRLKDMPI